MPSPTESSSFAPQGESGPFHSTGACPGSARISPLVPCACDTATDAAAGSHNPAAEAPVPQATAARLARTDSRELPSLSHVAPPGVSEPVPGRLGSHQSPSPFLLLAPLSNQGPFPPPALPGFPGTTGLSATPTGPACPSRGSGWRVPRHRRGFPCCVHPPFCACRRHYPGGIDRCARRSLPDRCQPSPIYRRVGFRIMSFEACSAFTHVAARTVAEPPSAAPCTEVLQSMSLPPSTAPIATGWSDSCRAGFAPAEEWRLCTAHRRSQIDIKKSS